MEIKKKKVSESSRYEERGKRSSYSYSWWIWLWSSQDTFQWESERQIHQTGNICMSHSAVAMHFVRTDFLLLLLLFCPSLATLPPTISPSLACTSSGHGSLSQLQRGRVWTGSLSHTAPNMLLKQKYTIAYMSITKHANTNGQSAFLWLCFFTFLSL